MSEGMIEDLKNFSDKKIKKEASRLMKTNYIEPLQYVVKTDGLFPVDIDHELHQKVPT